MIAQLKDNYEGISENMDRKCAMPWKFQKQKNITARKL